MMGMAQEEDTVAAGLEARGEQRGACLHRGEAQPTGFDRGASCQNTKWGFSVRPFFFLSALEIP
jgi:hypothetical protein